MYRITAWLSKRAIFYVLGGCITSSGWLEKEKKRLEYLGTQTAIRPYAEVAQEHGIIGKVSLKRRVALFRLDLDGEEDFGLSKHDNNDNSEDDDSANESGESNNNPEPNKASNESKQTSTV